MQFKIIKYIVVPDNVVAVICSFQNMASTDFENLSDGFVSPRLFLLGNNRVNGRR